jgi:hypothetical protein
LKALLNLVSGSPSADAVILSEARAGLGYDIPGRTSQLAVALDTETGWMFVKGLRLDE